MAITLNHTIVPVRNKDAAARFFARMFDLPMTALADILQPCGSTTA